MIKLVLKSLDREHQCYMVINGRFKSSLVGKNTAVVNLREKTVVKYSLVDKNNKKTEGEDFLKNLFSGFSARKHPMLLPSYLAIKVGGEYRIYKSVQFFESSILFLNVDRDKTFNIKGDLLELCEDADDKNIIALSNQDAYYKKYHEDNEIEYKFNLSTKTDIWSMATAFQSLIKNNTLPNFILQYLDNFNQWDFENYLYEVTSPENSVGYISFIKCPDEKYVIKQKIFKKDSLERVEIRKKNVELKKSKENYLDENYPEIAYKKLYPFRRQRYDINIESLNTGNIYSIMFDSSVVVGRPEHVLVQCEIEYIKTRTSGDIDNVKEELNELNNFVKGVFGKEGVGYKETFYSKLTFLKDLQEKLNLNE